MMKSAALVSRIEGTEKNQRKVVEYFLCKQQSTKYGIAYAIDRVRRWDLESKHDTYWDVGSTEGKVGRRRSYPPAPAATYHYSLSQSRGVRYFAADCRKVAIMCRYWRSIYPHYQLRIEPIPRILKTQQHNSIIVDCCLQ